MTLSPCATCRRHARTDEIHCPFCGAAMKLASQSVVTRAAASVTRAAVFAGAALAITGCSETKPEAPTEPTPVSAPADAAAIEPPPPKKVVADAGIADAAHDAAVTKKKKRKKQKKQKKEPLVPKDVPKNIYPPYGAPPSPDDVIV